MVQRAVLDGIIELRHARRVEFFGFHVAKVFEKFLPAFPEEPGFVAAAPEREGEQEKGQE